MKGSRAAGDDGYGEHATGGPGSGVKPVVSPVAKNSERTDAAGMNLLIGHSAGTI
ncbi:MAG: hypothetical protein ACLTW9_30340 [Enterocloster sp.]